MLVTTDQKINILTQLQKQIFGTAVLSIQKIKN